MTREEYDELEPWQRRAYLRRCSALKLHPDGTPWAWDPDTWEPMPWSFEDWTG